MINKVFKNIPFICVGLWVLLSISCDSACKITLQITNNTAEKGFITLIDKNGGFMHSEVAAGQTKLFGTAIMQNIVIVYIEGEVIAGIFSFREYDHWITSSHNVIITMSDEFIIENDRLNVNAAFNYGRNGYDFAGEKRSFYSYFGLDRTGQYQNIDDILSTR
ncbi:MAG: hypothetical protein FWE37_04975 [Spirochaetaceae bacterium]|nr:hypothetical protein [Spirochaetaceae bacterium]